MGNVEMSKEMIRVLGEAIVHYVNSGLLKFF